MIVNYNVENSYIKQYLEPIMHVMAIVSPLPIFIAAHFLDLLNPIANSAVCWVQKYPYGCNPGEGECIRGGEWDCHFRYWI